MTTTALRNRPALRYATLSTAFARTRSTFRLWSERARQRTHLSELSPAMLEDIGVSAPAARAEANRPFWLG
ncbi:MAG: DUF1127 domain-containing protein [Proteobacteria bacterium]|jgi:uncharacterized protein YjiS (DUF1127 family)|nr:DUF1127 domain-containing protein [Pseudomonadota bacterium]